MKLVDLKPGEQAVISKVQGIGAFRKRILEMGFVAGRSIKSVKKAPLQDPVEYRLMDYEVSLRNSEAELIEVMPQADLPDKLAKKIIGIEENESLTEPITEFGREINVAFVGNPNCGKTTIFNFASKSRERVGNYGGVTVDAKEAKFKHRGYNFNLIDLPGTYSITAYSPEELYVRDYIINHTPDVVVNVIDGSNLERNLYLTTQLIDMDLKVVAALNMYDELEEKGDKFDYDRLGKMIGIPFVPTVASKGKGINELFDKIIDVYHHLDKTVRHVHISYGLTIENAVKDIRNELAKENPGKYAGRISSRFLAVKLLEKDAAAQEHLREYKNAGEVEKKVKSNIFEIEKEYRNDSEGVITDARYGFIAGAMKETFIHKESDKLPKSVKIDKLITHKVLGIPIFFFLMWASFYLTFTLGEYPMNWIENLVAFVSGNMASVMSESILKDLIIDGIIGGVGGVIVFLPNIVLLYLFISLMEDTGYMARAVFMMDKAMHKMGLHGKSFIPLLMGFGCNVPAILSSRIIESKRDRLITILINPFMSCSARFTVYVLFISAFYISYQSLMLFLLYFIGIILAIGSALLFRKTLFREKDIPFVMELPPYRWPTTRTVIRHMWFRASQYLKKVGGVILIASIIIWALGYFPRNEKIVKDYDHLISQAAMNYNSLIETESDSSKISYLERKKEEKLYEINLEKKSVVQEKSFIGVIGHSIEKIMAPLGFDWRMSVAILTGVAAKEVVVGSLGVLYQVESRDEKVSTSLIKKLQHQTYKTGKRRGERMFSPLIAFSFMLFILIYFPCIGVIAAIKKESGSWKWALFSILYTTTLAWIISFLTFQIGSFFI